VQRPGWERIFGPFGELSETQEDGSIEGRAGLRIRDEEIAGTEEVAVSVHEGPSSRGGLHSKDNRQSPVGVQLGLIKHVNQLQHLIVHGEWIVGACLQVREISWSLHCSLVLSATS
jgi:hypothetical protein